MSRFAAGWFDEMRTRHAHESGGGGQLGSFVQAAYDQYASDPGQANPAAIMNMPAGYNQLPGESEVEPALRPRAEHLPARAVARHGAAEPGLQVTRLTAASFPVGIGTGWAITVAPPWIVAGTCRPAVPGPVTAVLPGPVAGARGRGRPLGVARAGRGSPRVVSALGL